MATNGFSTRETITHARDTLWPYRSGMGMINSAEWIVFFDDFVGSVASNVPDGWGAAIIDTGATITSYASATGGVIRVTSDAASEGVSIYLPKSIKLTGKKFFMEVRVRTGDADDTDLRFGLSDLSATSDPEDMWDTSNADMLNFGVSDGDATPTLIYDKDNGGPVTDTASGTTYDLADATWVTLGLYYNGATTDSQKVARGYVDGQLAITAATNAQVPEDVILAPFVGARGGDGGVGTIDIDYFRFAIER